MPDLELGAVVLEADTMQIMLGIPSTIKTVIALTGAIDRLVERIQLVVEI